MELRHLRYFVALAEDLHFTRAAEKVHVSQSTLSHQIRQLEDEIGRPLFDRIGKRVFLTQEGERFLAKVTRALEEIDSGLLSLEPGGAEQSGEVRIGATMSLAGALAPQCIATFIDRNPSAKVSILEMTPDVIRRELLQETIDIGLAYPPLDATGLWQEPLFEERVLLVVRKSHPLARRRRVRLIDLHGQRMVMPTQNFSIRHVFDGYFRSVGAKPKLVVEGNSLSMTHALMLATDIATILPESAVPASGPFKAIPLDRPAPARTPTIYLKRERAQSALVKAMAEILKQRSLLRGQTAKRARRRA